MYQIGPYRAIGYCPAYPSWVIISASLLSLCRMSELERARVTVTKIQVASSGAHNVVQPITKENNKKPIWNSQ